MPIGAVIATGSAVDSVAQEDVHVCRRVAAITGWAAKCSEEEGALDGAGVVTTAGSAAKCTAKGAVPHDTGMVITTLFSVNTIVKECFLVCFRFAATAGSVDTCSVTMS